jgi:hypothetical protein
VRSDRPSDASVDPPYVSTGHLPSPEVVRALVFESYFLHHPSWVRPGDIGDSLFLRHR